MTDRSGQNLGSYRLIRLLGRGGFADVYLGEHRSLNTSAAIKVLNTHLAAQEEVEQFCREAYFIARLVHPHIVRVLDFGVEGDTPFLVMDHAPYGTLRQHHPQGTVVPLPTILPYVQQVAAALQYAHDQQIIHRDVKPENLLLGRQGEIWLSDFGIAVVAPTTGALPPQQPVHTVGTVAYMAPEHLRGEPRPASDQYALAIVIYEWLGGRRPFSGTTLELAYKHQFVAPEPLRSLGNAIPPEVDEVILQALAKNPEARFASVQAFATALEAASQEAALLRMESSPSQPAFQTPSTNPLDPLALLPTKILPERQPRRPPDLPLPVDPAGQEVQEEIWEPAPKEGSVPFGEQTTWPRPGRANRPAPLPPERSRRRLARRIGPALLAAVLLLVFLGAALLFITRSAFGNAPGSLSVTVTSTPLALSSSPRPGQTPHSSPGATRTVLPTSPGSTSTTGPGSTATAVPSPTLTPLPPHMAVSPQSLSFTLSLVNCLLSNPPTQQLTIQNTGAGSMDWQAAPQDSTYLTISPNSSHLAPGQSVTITVSLICKGTVLTTDPITFTSNGGGTVVVNVSITLS